MRVSYTTYSAPTWSLERHVAVATELGCDGLELRNLDGQPIDPTMPEEPRTAIFETVADAGLEICVVGSSARFALPSAADRRQAVEQAVAFVELADAWDAPIVRVFGGNYDPGPSDDEVNGWVAEALREVAIAADPYGIRLALETHDAFSTGQRVRRVLDLADHSGIGVVWDFAHPVRHGETVDQTWGLIHSDVIHTHFKDMKLTGGGRDGWESVGPGDGDLPLADMVGRLIQSHYDGYLSTEWEGRDPDGADDPTDALRAHTASIRNLIAKARGN
ncbi:MAG: sugar phosphate isomerase/epimerase [Chloroflexota bacterium]|nr:sugar phosphate isomerase/epimerase [Chloroflexota bacterium]MDE2919688.1 sugar phosphate isomerase/epimerase [Chloroflexota bacterium]